MMLLLIKAIRKNTIEQSTQKCKEQIYTAFASWRLGTLLQRECTIEFWD